MVYQYKWRNGGYPVPAQKAGEYLNNLAEKENGVTAERLLELSRDEDSLMHPCFEWDDTKAAEKYRLDQSRRIIYSLVAVTVNETPIEPVRAFVSVTSTAHSERGVFKPIVTALSNSEEHQIILNNALRDMRLFREKYYYLTELANVFKEMDKVINNS